MANDFEKVEKSQLESAIKAVSLNDFELFKQITLEPLQSLPVVFEKALQKPKRGEIIKICVEKGALNQKNINYYISICAKSLCNENLETLLKLGNRFEVSLEDLYKALNYYIDHITDENFESASKCIEVLLKESCDGLEMMGNDSSPLMKFIEKSKNITKDKKTIMEVFMDFSFFDSISCSKIFEGNSSFSKSCGYMEDLLRSGDRDNFKKSLKSYLEQNDLLRKYPKKIKHYNVAAEHYDKIIQSSNDRKVTEIKFCNFDEESRRFLEIATDKSYLDVVKFIVTDMKNIDVISSVEIACKKGYHEILTSLLKHVKCYQEIEGRCLLHSVCDKLHLTQNQENSQQNFQECFKLLIQKFPDIVHEKDHRRNTPLHLTIKSRSNTNETVMLLESGSSLSAKNKKGRRPIDDINRSCLKSFLNTRVTFRQCDRNLEVDLTFLAEKQGVKGFNESFLLHKMQENPESKPLIAHPVISSFIYLKWWNLRLFLLLNFFLESIFILSLSTYIFSRRYSNSSDENFVKTWSTRAFYAISSVISLREFVKILFSPKKYFKKLGNAFELLFIIIAILTIAEVLPFSRHILLVVFMISCFKFFKIFGALPYLNVSIYMAMLEKVTMTFLKSFAVFFMIPISFAFSFNLVYFISESDKKMSQWKMENSNSTDDEEAFNSFKDPLLAIVKTLSMMTGEFDTSSMNLNKSYWITFLFIFFVFIVAIVLLNLLNALAISDTQKIIDEGEIADLSMKIKVLYKYEKLVAKDTFKFSKWIHNTMKVFDDKKIGKIVIDLIDKKIRMHDKINGYEDLPPKVFFFMDCDVVKNLQNIVNENKENEIIEQKEKELRERLKTVEKLLTEVLRKLDSAG